MSNATYRFDIDWNNDGEFSGAGDVGEDVTARTLRRSPVTIQYGRDQARSLSPIQSGRAQLELDNQSKDYSPENPASPLAGNLKPGRPVRMQATLGAETHVLYRGFLDDYDMLPGIEDRSVQFTALDALARMQGVTLSTPVHHSIQTGDAINLVLDAVGWPTADRDLDQGATTIRWWWEEGTNALAALTKIVESEGPAALATVDADGNFVFRDRHHRLTRTASVTSQATFRDNDGEPLFSAPLVYDIGWRDIINSVSIDVDELRPALVPEVVFETEQSYSIAARATVEVGVSSSQPFINAIRPAAGTDYTLRSGSVSVALSRTSGEAAVVRLTAGSLGAVIEGLRVRAIPLEGTPLQVSVEDPLSIDEYGPRSYPHPAPWCGIHDAKAIAELILAHRSTRLPIVTMRVVSANDTRLTQQLTRDLSDRITIVEEQTDLNADFFIEQIKHTISDAGKLHETVFGCEMVPRGTIRPFQFDVSGRGFNQGAFQGDDAATVFRLNTSGQGLNDGRLAT